MDPARLPGALPEALQELGVASLHVIGTAQAKDGLRRALAGQMGDDEAQVLSAEVRALARTMAPAAGR